MHEDERLSSKQGFLFKDVCVSYMCKEKKNACIWNRTLVFNDVQIYDILENRGSNCQISI